MMHAFRPLRRSCGPSVPLGEHGLAGRAVSGHGDPHGPRGRLRTGHHLARRGEARVVPRSSCNTRVLSDLPQDFQRGTTLPFGRSSRIALTEVKVFPTLVST